MSQCSICLSTFRDPVSIPCGHVYCKLCLNGYVTAPGNQSLKAKCPDCRKTFDLVVPDLTHLPEKYHPFVSRPVRRIYVEASSSSNSSVEEALKAAEIRLVSKAASEEQLLKRCEDLTGVLDAHRQGERDANLRIMELEEDLAEIQTYLKQKDLRIKELENANADSMAKLEKQQPKYSNILSTKNEKGLEKIILPTSDASSNAVTRLVQIENATPEALAARKLKLDIVANSDKTKQLSKAVVGASCPASLAVSPSVVPVTPVPAASDPSRPVKALPKRRGHGSRKTVEAQDASFMSIDLSGIIQ